MKVKQKTFAQKNTFCVKRLMYDSAYVIAILHSMDYYKQYKIN